MCVCVCVCECVCHGEFVNYRCLLVVAAVVAAGCGGWGGSVVFGSVWVAWGVKLSALSSQQKEEQRNVSCELCAVCCVLCLF